MPIDPSLARFVDTIRSRFDSARLAAKPEFPEYPVNDFADDPTMQAQQTFLAVHVTPDDALRTGSGFVGALTVPLSRVLPLVPRSDMDVVADALDLGSHRAVVRQAMRGPQGYEFRSDSLDITSPSFHACAESLVRAARKYNHEVFCACCEATIYLRRSDVTIRGYFPNRVAGSDIRKLYEIAKSLRANNQNAREFVQEYERASDMLAVHRYLAAHKAADQAQMDALREESAVSLFLRCGDLDP